MKSHARAAVAILLTAGTLVLAGCTSDAPAPVQTTAAPQPSVSVPVTPVSPQPSTQVPIGNPAKYALTSQEFPTNVSMLLRSNGKFAEKTSSQTGQVYNDTCGVVFLYDQFVKTATLLTPEQQQAQSLALITNYEQRAGRAAKIDVGTLNTNEQIAGSSDNYTIEAERATIDNKNYSGVVYARVFANGKGVAVSFLCRPGSVVPSTDDNVVLNIG